MKKYIFSAVGLFLFCFSFSQALQNEARLTPLEEQKIRDKCEEKRKNSFLTPDECFKIKSPETRIADLKFAIDTGLSKKAKDNYLAYYRLDESVPDKKPIRPFVVVVIVIAIGVGLLVTPHFVIFLKNKFAHAKNKINLRQKKRKGKHSLDDVFAAEEKE